MLQLIWDFSLNPHRIEITREVKFELGLGS